METFGFCFKSTYTETKRVSLSNVTDRLLRYGEYTYKVLLRQEGEGKFTHSHAHGT